MKKSNCATVCLFFSIFFTVFSSNFFQVNAEDVNPTQFSTTVADWAKSVKDEGANLSSVDLGEFREALWSIQELPESVATFFVEPNRPSKRPAKNPSAPFDHLVRFSFLPCLMHVLTQLPV